MSKKTLEGYKVVLDSCTKDTYKSVSSAIGLRIIGPEGVHKYTKDKWTHRKNKCGPLAVFTHQLHADMFLNTHSFMVLYGITVHKCKYIPSKATSIWMPSILTKRKRVSRKLSECPMGTVLANSVMIL